MKNWDVQKLLPLLRECGEIALHYYDDPPIEIKADKSIVTAADKAIEMKLAEEFDRPAEGVYLIGEETVKSRSEDYIQKALHGTAWIVDPIDGTAPYSIGLPAWGISVALMENGVIKEGAVYLPPQNDCLFTDGNRVGRCADMRGGGQVDDFKFKAHPFGPDGIISVSQLGTKIGSFFMSNQVFAWSGCVASFYQVFTGKILAYIASFKLWDVAASLALMKHSAVAARFYDGKVLSTVINDDFFELGPESPERWKIRSHVIIAPDDETYDFILGNSKIPETQ